MKPTATFTLFVKVKHKYTFLLSKKVYFNETFYSKLIHCLFLERYLYVPDDDFHAKLILQAL